MPRAEAPGIPNRGFISGERTLLRSLTTPNSVSRPDSAPAMTAMAIMKKTVFVSRE